MSTPKDGLLAKNTAGSAQNVAPFVRRSPRISREQVFRAADELLSEGHKPTIDRVRVRLGRGSPNTINEHLDAWWAKLGSRLHGLPGREIPQLPQAVSQTLQQLWNQALEGAREAVHGAQEHREHELLLREQALDAGARDLAERERAAAARQSALEGSLQLAREQLSSANRTVEQLEIALRERDAEQAQSRAWIEALSGASEDLQRRIQAGASAHESERRLLQEQHATAEARWLLEVDRARQALKAAQKDHERVLGELRHQTGTQAQREHEMLLREQALEVRAGQLAEREQSAAGRQSLLEESLRLAREQLSSADRTVEQLENALRERDAEQAQSRAWIEALSGASEDLQRRIQAGASAHESERRQLQEQHAAAEARWRLEVDRARQALKEAEKEHERIHGELRQQAGTQAQREHELQLREQAAAGRQSALEESLQLAREQLLAVNRTVEQLETAVRERDAEQAQSRAWIEALSGASEDLQRRLQAGTNAHENERRQLQEQHAAAEARWLLEFDQARQALKEAQKEHERVLGELRQQIDTLHGVRDQLRHELAETRGDLKAAAAVRQQLEDRLRRS
jgi:uncharacterized UPF0160 family protein